MTGKTHKLISLTTCATILYATSNTQTVPSDLHNIVTLTCGAAGAVIGSLICDIDEPNSTIGRILWFVTFPIALLKFLLSFVSLFFYGKFGKLLDNINKSTDHRGITHSIITWIFLNVCYIILYKYSLQYTDKSISFNLGIFFLCVAVGSLTHLVADFCSGNGIPLLEPFSHTRFGTRKLTGFSVAYNGIGELSIRLLCVISLLAEIKYQVMT